MEEEKKYRVAVTRHTARVRSKRQREGGVRVVLASMSASETSSVSSSESRLPLEVVNVGNDEEPMWALHSPLPFYSDGWVSGGGTGSVASGDEDGDEEGGSAGVGSDGDRHYEHRQTEASSVWVIVHNLDKWPSVTVVDDAGNVVVGDVVYVNKDTVRVVFSAEFSGRAYLN